MTKVLLLIGFCLNLLVFEVLWRPSSTLVIFFDGSDTNYHFTVQQPKKMERNLSVKSFLWVENCFQFSQLFVILDMVNEDKKEFFFLRLNNGSSLFTYEILHTVVCD